MQPLCVLVIGHKNTSPGAVNPASGVSEFVFGEALAARIAAKVRGVRIQVVYRRTYETLPGDVNAFGPDFVISLHANSSGNGRASGTETLYYHCSSRSKALAEIVQARLVAALGLRDRGVAARTSSDRGGLILAGTHAPCVIGGPFFIDKNSDYERAVQRFDALAAAYAAAIEDYAATLDRPSAPGGPGPDEAETLSRRLRAPADHGVEHYIVDRGQIYMAATGGRVGLIGVSWYGLDTPDCAPHGLWTGRRLSDVMQQVHAAGFTAIRIPVSPWTIRPGRRPADWALQYGADGRAVLEATVLAAWNAQLFVLLDFHTFDPGRFPGGHAPGPNDPQGTYSEAQWRSDLVALADMARNYRNVVGIELFNEPHGLTWAEWRPMAERAGQAALATHPGLIMFISGVASVSGSFWGEDLTLARSQPIDPAFIPAAKRAYIPHTYGPDVFNQPYFNQGGFPANLPAIWDRKFGFLDGQDCVCIGEFGGHGRPGTQDAQWQEAFVDYLASKQSMPFNWFYWCLNPESGDTGGLFEADWRTWRADKLARLRRIMPAPAAGPGFPRNTSRSRGVRRP